MGASIATDASSGSFDDLAERAEPFVEEGIDEDGLVLRIHDLVVAGLLARTDPEQPRNGSIPSDAETPEVNRSATPLNRDGILRHVRNLIQVAPIFGVERFVRQRRGGVPQSCLDVGLERLRRDVGGSADRTDCQGER